MIAFASAAPMAGIEAIEKMTQGMLEGEPLRSVADLAASAPAWARAFVGAAERRVRELDEALCGAREDISKLRQRAETFVAENEELHLRLTEAVGARGDDAGGAEVPGPRGLGGAAEERAREMGERVEILMAENALLVEQSSVLQGELDRCVGERDATASRNGALADELGACRERLAALEEAEASRREAQAALEARYVKHGAEVASANSQLGELKEGLAALHGQNGRLRDELADKARVCDELRGRLEADGDELRDVRARAQRRQGRAVAVEVARRCRGGAERRGQHGDYDGCPHHHA